MSDSCAPLSSNTTTYLHYYLNIIHFIIYYLKVRSQLVVDTQTESHIQSLRMIPLPTHPPIHPETDCQLRIGLRIVT